MNKEQTITALRNLRFQVEREAEVPICEIDCTMLTALYDVCVALGLDGPARRRVLGKAIDLLGPDKTDQSGDMVPLFDLNLYGRVS